MKSKLPRGTLEKLWSNPASWQAIGIYCCKADPRIIVPKRNRWAGWTMNFAHAAAWWELLLCIPVLIAPFILIVKTGRREWIVPALAFIIILSVVWSKHRSSPKRFESDE